MNRTKIITLLSDTTTRTQYGAICWRMHKAGIQVLLVTSRDTGRWIIPKGWPVEGATDAGSAEREAWEEAGVLGKMLPLCLGVYAYDKVVIPGRSIPCVVAVYPLRVTELKKRFPERKQRRRKWFSIEDAIRKVAEPELRQILSEFRPPSEAAIAAAGLAAAPGQVSGNPPVEPPRDSD
ncbi:NUDIX hydrolase [Tabrizicola sp. J26]|nr:NUDIX hydrolase [Tabrizicola rongguiensis]